MTRRGFSLPDAGAVAILIPREGSAARVPFPSAVRYGPCVLAPDSSPPATRVPALDAEAISSVIDWFQDARRDLPWREPGISAWAILVSEVMLQQTPVVRVQPRWVEWMRRWPTAADLAAAPTAELLRAWDRLGYPRRALRLQECARVLVADHGGELPTGLDDLRALPGVGEYTAAAVTAFAHQQRAVVVDTNIRRVLVRTIQGAALPAPGLTAGERNLAAASLPLERERSVAWNQAVMELGALVCTARVPRCEQCPLAGSACAWFAAGKPAPEPGRRRAQPFEGTDRQMRGRIMRQLRTGGPVPRSRLLDLDPHNPEQVLRCIASLVRDGLAVAEDGAAQEGTVRLP